MAMDHRSILGCDGPGHTDFMTSLAKKAVQETGPRSIAWAALPSAQVLSIVLLTLLYLFLALTDLTRVPRVNLDEPWLIERALYVLKDGLPRQVSMFENVYWLQPGYPYLLAGWFALTEVSMSAARLLSVAAGAGIVIVTFLLGRRFHSVGAGLVAALLLITDSHFLGHVRMARPEAPSVLLGLAGLLVFLHGMERKSAALSSLGGLLCGVAALCHANALWAPLVALVWYAVALGRRFFVSRVGWSYGFGFALVGLAYATALLIDREDIARQLANNSSRFPSLSLSLFLDTAAQEFGKYSYWYFGLITDATPNPILAVFKAFALLGYVFVLGRTALQWPRLKHDADWLRLLTLCLVVPLFMGVVVANKSHTYIINVLPPFALAAGVLLATAGALIGAGVIRVAGEGFGRLINGLLLLAIVVGSAGFAGRFYDDWFRRMRGTLATYEETTRSILAALPKGPATVVVNPVFLLPDKRPDIRFVSNAHLLPEVNTDFVVSNCKASIPVPDAFKSGWRLPLFVLVDRDSFEINTSLSACGLAWRQRAAEHFSQHCVVRSRIYTTNWDLLLLYECMRAGEGRPSETPGRPEIVIGGQRFRPSETTAEFGPSVIGSWRPIKSGQTVEVDAAGAHIKGGHGAGLVTTFKTAELGLLPGDVIAVEVAIDDTRPTDTLSLHGGIATKPHLLEGGLQSGQSGSSWHSLGSRPADGGPVSVVGRITGPTFELYVYSETSMTVKHVAIRRLMAAREGDRR